MGKGLIRDSRRRFHARCVISPPITTSSNHHGVSPRYAVYGDISPIKRTLVESVPAVNGGILAIVPPDRVDDRGIA